VKDDFVDPTIEIDVGKNLIGW